jgi:hypothetical protein
LKLLDYHRLKAAELEARDNARFESTVRSECADFPERIESLLPSPEEKYLSRNNWPHYQKFYSLCELYLAGTASQREYIRSRIDWQRAYQLGLFRLEAKEVAVHTKSTELLRLALVSLVINDFNCGDARDAILALESLLVAARKIGLDWSALVQSVADISGRGMGPLLRDFLANHAS